MESEENVDQRKQLGRQAPVLKKDKASPVKRNLTIDVNSNPKDLGENVSDLTESRKQANLGTFRLNASFEDNPDEADVVVSDHVLS